MKIIHAIWERKNLGMDAWEVMLDRKDMADISAIMEQLHAPEFAGCYVCVKLPVGDLHMIHALEDDGFRFLETQFHLVEALEKSDIMRYGESAGHIPVEERVVPKTREEWGKIIEKITPGMFDTDRIALDPAFGPDVACQRYRNWCWDLFDNPKSVLHVSSLEGEDIGFGIAVLIQEPDVYDGVLGGIFEAGKGCGMGVCIVRSGGKGKLKTTVSSNNVAMLKIHQNHGRIVRNERYVFRKIYPQSGLHPDRNPLHTP